MHAWLESQIRKGRHWNIASSPPGNSIMFPEIKTLASPAWKSTSHTRGKWPKLTDGDAEDSKSKERPREMDLSLGKVKAFRLARDLPTVPEVTTICPRCLIKWPPIWKLKTSNLNTAQRMLFSQVLKMFKSIHTVFSNFLLTHSYPFFPLPYSFLMSLH